MGLINKTFQNISATDQSGQNISVANNRVNDLTLIYIGVFSTLFVGVLLGHLLPPGKFEYGPGLAQHLLTWDALWYRDIAEYGYTWNPNVGTLWERYQNVAFFPLYPLIERLLMFITQGRSWITTIAPSAAFGLWSIAAFDRLAQKLLPDSQASLNATALYAFWPASCFFFMGYPTGLINLCIIFAIDAYMDRKFIRSVVWCGIGSAAAPTVVFVAFGLCLDRGLRWLLSSRKFKEGIEIVGFGLLSVSGLLAFMIYLWWRFGDPIVFMAAQAAWAVPSSVIPKETLLTHLELMFFPPWYGLSFFKTVMLCIKLINSHAEISRYEFSIMNNYFQYDINIIATLITIFLLFKYRKFGILFPTSLIVVIGYIWFFGSTYNYFINGARLLYPALIIFIAGGFFGAKHRHISKILLTVLFGLTSIEIALVWSGYMVI